MCGNCQLGKVSGEFDGVWCAWCAWCVFGFGVFGRGEARRNLWLDIGMAHAKFSSHLLDIFSRSNRKCECIIPVFYYLCLRVDLLVLQASAVHFKAFDARS